MRFSQRQPDRKCGANPFATFHRNPPAVELHQLFGQRQPDAGALEFPGGGAVHLEKAVEDVRQTLRRNANPGITDDDRGFTLAG